MEKVNAVSFGNRTGCPSKFYLEVYSLQNFFYCCFTSIHKWGKTSLSMNLKKYNSGNLHFPLEENPLSMWDLTSHRSSETGTWGSRFRENVPGNWWAPSLLLKILLCTIHRQLRATTVFWAGRGTKCISEMTHGPASTLALSRMLQEPASSSASACRLPRLVGAAPTAETGTRWDLPGVFSLHTGRVLT